MNECTTGYLLIFNLFVSGVSLKETRLVLKKCHINPYRVKFGQKIKETDKLTRVTMCNFFRRKIEQDRMFTRKIIFTDEATFHVDGTFNKQNFRYLPNNGEFRKIPLYAF